MKTGKNNKRKSRRGPRKRKSLKRGSIKRGSIKRGGMFGRLFGRTQPEPQMGIPMEQHPRYSVTHALLPNAALRARNLYTGKTAKAYVVPNTQRPTHNELSNFEIAIQIPNALKPYKMNKIDIETYGTPIVIDKNGYIDTTVNKKVCLLMNTLDYGLVYDYMSLGKNSYYIRLPKRIIDSHIIYPLYISASKLSKDIMVYEIPEQLMKV